MEEGHQSAYPIPSEDVRSLGGGRYRLASTLGTGGTATVFRAWDAKDQKWRAIKVLLPEFASRPRLRIRFANEAQTMLRINHRHVVQVYDVNTEGDVPYIVMELAQGGCVIDWVKAHGAMPPRMAIGVLMQVCKGLAAAHAAGVIHRDVKPHNMLITRRGVCRVADFGIAQNRESMGLTQTGNILGTLGYMSPEQRANSKTVGVTADIYGLGASLYKMITAGAVTDLFLASHDPTMLAGIPPVLHPILLQAVAYKPVDRYPDVGAFSRALHQAKRSLPATPTSTPPLPLALRSGTEVSTYGLLPLTSDSQSSTFNLDEMAAPTPPPYQAPPLPMQTPDAAPRFEPAGQTDQTADVETASTIRPTFREAIDETTMRTPGLGSLPRQTINPMAPRAVQPPVRRTKASISRLGLQLSVGVGVLLALVLGGVGVRSSVNGSIQQTNQALHKATSAQDVFYERIIGSAAIIDDLAGLGEDHTALLQRYNAFVGETSEPKRLALAMDWIRHISLLMENAERQSAPQRDNPAFQRAQTHLNVVSNARDAHLDSQSNLRRSRETTGAKLGIWLGALPQTTGPSVLDDGTNGISK